MTLKGIIGTAVTFVVVLGIIISALIFSEKVKEGEVAVVYSPSNGADRILTPGWHWYEIGLFEDTQKYPTRITIVEDSLSVTTSDGKKVTMPVKYEMKVDQSKVLDIFKELGSQDVESIQNGYLYQKLFKSARSVVSSYSVIDIYGTKTAEASAAVTEKFAKDVEKLGFIITDVTLGTPELDPATQTAIDARVQAAQELEKLELDKQIATQQAEKKKIEAEGQAAAEIEKARGVAEANRILEQSITPDLIKLKEAEARLQHGWVTVKTGQAIVEAK